MRAAIALWLVVGVLAACSLAPLASAEQGTELQKRGEALLLTNCARCHAVGRTGVSPRPDAPRFRTLSGKYPIESLAEALGQGLSVGHEDMPEFVFDPADVGAIIDYLESIQER
jgi:mono/diheme cytochrome c family protein